jgi:hypothetical protein
MLSRHLLISTCVLALIATPALPQTSPQQALAARAAPSVPGGPAPTMREMLRAWGLDRPSRDVQFRAGESTAERAVFNTLVLRDADGSSSTLENLVVTRNAIPGANLGEFTITMDKFNDNKGTRIGNMSIVGVRGASNILTAFKAANSVSGRRQSPSNNNTGDKSVFAKSMSISDIVTSTVTDGETVGMKLGQLTISDINFNSNISSLGTISMRDGAFDYKDFSAKFANAQISGINAAQFEQFSLEDGDPRKKPFDIMGFELGNFSINAISYTFKGENNAPPPLNTMSIANFSVDNIKDGFIGRFNLSGVKMNGGVGAQAWDFGLTRFAMGGINMRYFEEVGYAVGKNFERAKAAPEAVGEVADAAPRVVDAAAGLPPPQTTNSATPSGTALPKATAGKEKPRNVVVSMDPVPPNAADSPATRAADAAADAVEAAASAAADTPAPRSARPKAAAKAAPPASPPAPPRPRILVKDMLKGGPLDGGFRSIDFAGLNVAAMGFGFTIDQIGVNQTRNSNDIITRTEIIPTLMRFSWPSGPANKDNPLSQMFEMLGTDHIAMRLTGTSTYSPQTDRVTLEKQEIEVVGWGKISLDFAMSGLNRLFSRVTTEELFGAAAMSGAGTPSSQLSQLLRVYGDVTIDSARMDVTDQSGIDKVARIFARIEQGDRTPRPTITAAQIKKIRDGWAAPLRSASGDKSKIQLERQFGISIARWLETGGIITVEANPPRPIPLSSLEDDADTITPETFGLKVTNRPAGAPAPR